MRYEIITCDRCNEDGEIDMERLGADDDGHEGQVSGNEDVALEKGWIIDEDADYRHMCPACQEDDLVGEDD